MDDRILEKIQKICGQLLSASKEIVYDNPNEEVMFAIFTLASLFMIRTRGDFTEEQKEFLRGERTWEISELTARFASDEANRILKESFNSRN